MSLHSSFQLQ